MPYFRVKRVDGEELSCFYSQGKGPGLVYLHGFFSSMQGERGLYFKNYCEKQGRAFLALDYLGHGQSSGDLLEKGTIGRWKEDIVALIKEIDAPHSWVLFGSSLGGWLSVLVAQELKKAICALCAVAPAFDFTHDQIYRHINDDIEKAWARDGYIETKLPGVEHPYKITRELVYEGEDHLVLDPKKSLDLIMPMRLFHGMKDGVIPYANTVTFCQKVASTDVALTLVKEEGHRFHSAHAYALVSQALEGLF